MIYVNYQNSLLKDYCNARIERTTSAVGCGALSVVCLSRFVRTAAKWSASTGAKRFSRASTCLLFGVIALEDGQRAYQHHVCQREALAAMPADALPRVRALSLRQVYDVAYAEAGLATPKTFVYWCRFGLVFNEDKPLSVVPVAS